MGISKGKRIITGLFAKNRVIIEHYFSKMRKSQEKLLTNKTKKAIYYIDVSQEASTKYKMETH